MEENYDEKRVEFKAKQLEDWIGELKVFVKRFNDADRVCKEGMDLYLKRFGSTKKLIANIKREASEEFRYKMQQIYGSYSYETYLAVKYIVNEDYEKIVQYQFTEELEP